MVGFGRHIAVSLAMLASAAPAHSASLMVGVGTGYDGSQTSRKEGTYRFAGPTNPSDWGLNDNGVYRGGNSWTDPRVELTTTAVGGSAKSYADLSTGKLGVYGASTAQGWAGGGAMFTDELTFSVQGGDVATITPLRFLLSVHANDPSVVLGFQFNVGNALYSQSGLLSQDGAATGPWQSFTTWMDGDTRYFDAVYNLVGANRTFGIGMSMNATAFNGAVVDLYHTAAFGLSAPTGVSYSSSSGHFLTALAPVPEPSTWFYLIFGFGVIGHALRRRPNMVLAAS